MKRLVLAALIVLYAAQIWPERLELENIRIISTASTYRVYEPRVNHKTRRIKREKISTLQMELSAEMVRQARRTDRALP